MKIEDVEIFDSENLCKVGEKIFNEFNNDVMINTLTLRDHIDNAGLAYSKWSHYKNQAKHQLEKLNNDLEDLYQKLEFEIEHSDDPRKRALANTKSGLKRVVESTDVYKKLKRKIQKQERVVEVLIELVSYLNFNGQKAITNKLHLMELENKGF